MNKFDLVVNNGKLFLSPDLTRMLMSHENALMLISADNIIGFSKIVKDYLADDETNKLFLADFYNNEVALIRHFISATFYFRELHCNITDSIEEKLKKMYEFVNANYDFDCFESTFSWETNLDVFEDETYRDWFYPAFNLMALEIITSEDEELLNEYKDLFFGGYGLISGFSLEGFEEKTPFFSKEKTLLKKYLIKKYCTSEEYEEYLGLPDSVNSTMYEFDTYENYRKFKEKYIDRAIYLQNKAYYGMILNFLNTYRKDFVRFYD